MATQTFNSIGSTYTDSSHKNTNYSTSANNILEGRSSYEYVIYAFYAPAMAKKKVKSVSFSCNVLSCKSWDWDNKKQDYVVVSTTQSKINAFFIGSYASNVIGAITWNNYKSDYFNKILGTNAYSEIDITKGQNFSKSINYTSYSKFNDYIYVLLYGVDTYDSTLAKTATLTVTYDEPTNWSVIEYPNGNTIDAEKNYTAQTRTYTEISTGLTVISQSASVTQGGKTTSLEKIGGDPNVHPAQWIIPGGTIGEGSATFTHRATLESGNAVLTTATFYGQLATPKATPTYPIDISVKASNKLIFTWNYESETFDSPQKSVAIKITQNGNTITRTKTTSEHFYELAANTLSVGNASYTITVTNNAGKSYTSAPVSFYVIAQSGAPDITAVSNTAIPTVSWNAEYQDAYEIKFYQGETLLYESGLQVGQNVRSATIPLVLKNGNYNISIRALNTYGLYTDWSSYSYILNAMEPEAPTNIKVTVNENCGVNISFDTPANYERLYVIRRDIEGKEVILGRTEGNYTDYTARPNTPYEYTVRHSKAGAIDGEWLAVRTLLEGVMLYGGNNMSEALRLDSNRDKFEISHSESVTRTLVKCLGRKYPVKEGSEWVDTVREFSAFVSDQNMPKLERIIQSEKIYYKGEKEFFACDVEMSSTSDYVIGGKLIKFTVTRIEGDEVVVI